MGGGRRKQQQWTDWSGQYKEERDRRWQYWQGSWPRSPREPTRYDQMPVQTEHASSSTDGTDVRMDAWDASSSGTALMQAIQKTLTSGRKAEGKVRRLREEIARRDAQWQAYVKSLKVKYSNQKKLHSTDIQKLRQDLQQATDHSQAAAQQVIQLVNGGLQPEPQESAVDDEGWEDLVASAEPPANPGDFMQAALLAARAMQQAGRAGAGTDSARNPMQDARVVHGPPGGEPGATYAAPPPGLTEAGLPEHPYQLSPSTGTIMPATSPNAKGRAAPKDAQRRGVKYRAPPSSGLAPGPSLGQKLVDKREAILQQLAREGGAPNLPPGLSFDVTGELRAAMEGYIAPTPAAPSALMPFRGGAPATTATPPGAEPRPPEDGIGPVPAVSLESDDDFEENMAAASLRQTFRSYPSPPDPMVETAGVPARQTPDFIDDAAIPKGPPVPRPLYVEIRNHVQHTVPVVTEDVNFSIWIAAPGYQPQVLQFPLGVPSDIEDALEATERRLQNPLPFCDRLIAVRPQPFHTCAAAILAPDWSSYAALSLLCLDLRDMVPGGKGPIFTAYVTRPTSVEELRREAGALGTRPAAIYVGTDATPLQRDESVVLASGSLVTFMSSESCPNYANDLQYRLQFPRIWDLPAQFPKQAPGQTALLLLHRFVGVDRASVALHTPRDQVLAGHDTLVFGFEYVTPDSDASSSPFDPTTDDENGDDNESEEEEPSSDSEATTRSRSRRRANRRGPRSEPSSDPSYHGGLDNDTYPMEGFRGWLGVSLSRFRSDNDDVNTGISPLRLDSACDPGSLDLARCRVQVVAPPDVLHLHCTFNLPSAFSAGLRILQDPAVGSPLAHDALLGIGHAAVCAVRRFQCRDSPCEHNGLADWLCRTYRLLIEPTSATAEAARALADLRRVTEELGDDWPFDVNGRNVMLPPNVVDPVPDQTAEEATAKAIAFEIYVPDYSVERLTVEVQFPAIPTDIIPLLQRARDPQQSERFPHLLAAWPQPVRGIGTYVALPHWQPTVLVVLINAEAIDGRLYAAQAPMYADRSTLCDIADLPAAAEIAVYVDVSDQPLEGDAMAHLTSGATITFIERHNAPPVFQDYHRLLLEAGNWRGTHDGHDEPLGVYCLVFGHRHKRFHADLDDPFHYRQQIARAIGASASPVHIAPAVPRVTGIAIDGVDCRTAIAVERVDPVARVRGQTVLVDCRAVFEGWICWPAHNGLLLYEDLLVDLRFSVPAGYDVAVSGAWHDGAFLHVVDGSVLSVDYVRQQDLFDTGHTRVEERANEPALADFASANSDAEATTTVEDMPPHVPVLPGNAETSSRSAVNALPVHIQVLVVAPCYLAELHELSVHLPVRLPDFIKDVANLRRPVDARRFPGLVPVEPQLDPRFAVLVATPAWPHAQCTICIDSRQLDGRYFAMNAPATVDYGSLCTLADIPVDQRVRIFCRDVPWAVEPGTTINVADGDLITVLPASFDPPRRTRLDDMLQRTVGWTSTDDFVTAYDDHVWVVTDSEPVLYTADRRRVAHFRTDLAAALGAHSSSLVICPTKPPVRDFQDKGRFVSSVILAVEQSIPDFADTAPPVPFAIDLRPIYLDIVAAYAPSQGYDVGDLARRLAGFCPSGFQVVIFSGQPPTPVAGPIREVIRGEVLSVEFLPSCASGSGDCLSSSEGATTALPRDHSLEDTRAPRSDDQARTDSSTGGPGSSTDWPHTIPGSSAIKRSSCGATAAFILSVLCFWALLFHCHPSPPNTPDVKIFALCAVCLIGGRRDRTLLTVWVLGSLLTLAPLSAATKFGQVSPLTGENQVHALSLRRALPTPCRGVSSLPHCPGWQHTPTAEVSLVSGDIGPCVTLLEESVLHSDTWAFLAATLLDTLIENLEAVEEPDDPPRTTAVSLSLEDAVPTTRFQRACLELRETLPRWNGQDIDGIDWLDNDLSMLLHFSGATLQQRTAFVNIRCWHDAPAWNEALAIDVYTDGSASNAAAQLNAAPAGWAFTVWVRTRLGPRFYGAAYGTAVPPGTKYHLGEGQDTPLQSELLGICWALSWIVEFGPSLGKSIHLYYDCQAAGHGTFCLAKPAAPETEGRGLSWLAVVLRQCAERVVCLESAYIPGHAGYLGNELSDCFAKYARTQQQPIDDRLLPAWPACLARHPLAEWAWLIAAPADDLPRLYAFEAAANCLQKQAPPSRPPPTMGIQLPSTTEDPVIFEMTFMTYNVLTLLDPTGPHSKRKDVTAGLKIAGKRHMIVAQCIAAKIHLLGLQETRLQDTATLPDRHYIMLHSAATQGGHLGCAVWISKTLPYASQNGQKFFFESQHCTVAAYSVRHLLVSISAPHLKCAVLVAHAPSDPDDSEGLVRAFWMQCNKDLARLPAQLPVVVLADANSRLGSLVSPAVGPLAAEAETVAGALFHEFVLRHQMCLPSTFEEQHVGESWTWSSPTGLKHRLDYIAVPLAWLGFVSRSFTWADFEAMQKRHDHIPACLRCIFRRHPNAGPGVAAAFKRRACRPNDLDPQLSRQQFQVSLSQVSMPSWDTDVDTHFEAFVQAWTGAGQAIADGCHVRPRQAFLTEATMQLVWARKGLRLYIRQEETELRRRLQLVGFACWRLFVNGHVASEAARAKATDWLRDIYISIARAWSYLGQACTSLRAAVKRDRNHYLERLSKDVTLADISRPKQLFQRVRKAFPKAASARRSNFTALPAVELEDGTLAATNEARAQRWRDHFSEQESGQPVTTEEYRLALAQKDRKGGHESLQLDMSVLPSLLSLEGAILGLKRAKAAGPDGITAELLKVAPASAARHLLSLHLKSIMSVREPIEYKGGSLVTLAKRAAAAFGCNRHRSILISGVTGKILHKGLRTAVTPALLRVCPDLHGGVKPGIGVDTISLAVKSFQKLATAQGKLPAIVFYDVRAAYYQVLRECLTGDELDDKVLLRFFHRLGVPDSAFAELASQLSKIAVLPECGCSPHLVALIREVFTGTWFRMDRHVPLVATAAGVRPGDPLADVMFAVSFSAYARSVQTAIDAEGLQTTLPPSRLTPPWEVTAGSLVLGPASWADDFAAMHEASTPQMLVQRVTKVTSLYLTHATANGIQLSFAVDKTAAVLPPKVCFATEAGVCAGETGPFLPVLDSITGATQHLPVVQAYKHLGAIVTSTQTVGPEIHYRHSQATWTLRPLRGALFGNPSIPIATRRHLLQSLVASKFTFGSSTIEFMTTGNERLWARLYVSLFRALQPKGAQRKPHSYAVLQTARACTPPLALAKSRGGLLLRLIERGPEALRHLLFTQWETAPNKSWLGQLAADIQHVVLYCPGVKTIAEAPCPVRALLEAMTEDRTWWRRQIQAAIRQCLADLDTWVQQSSPAAPVRHEPSPNPEGDKPFGCPFCNVKFPLRKHLGVHLARSHGMLAPARLFMPTPVCTVCLRYFHTLPRVQRHLRGSKTCLLRASHLLSPMSLVDIKTAEAEDGGRLRKLRHGNWQVYSAAPPALSVYGPAQPTRSELRDWLAEDAPLSLLVDPPHDPSFLEWIRAEASVTTQEPPRCTAVSFWRKRVSFHSASF
ncbi:CFDP2 [Symbiodinium sp. KB8]|nr:CFDP2 [Symbiodinium sp. KB8]